MDQKGFPHRPRAEKIPAEAMLIQFSEMIDRESLIRMGECRREIGDAKKQVLEDQIKDGKTFSLLFLEKVRGAMKAAISSVG